MSGMFAFPEDDEGSDGGGDIGSTIFNPGSINLPNIDYGFADIGANLGADTNFGKFDINSLLDNPELLKSFEALYPEEARILQGLPSASEMAEYEKQASADVALGGVMSGNPFGTQAQSADTSGIKSFIDQAKKAIKDVTGLDAGDAAKYAAMLYMAKMAKEDAEAARKEARGWEAPGGAAKKVIRSPSGVRFEKAAQGGVMSLGMAQGRYLDGHSDGMADKVPAHIEGKRPAALSDGEFVIPADVVSHLGNGNSNAGAKRLYEMMDRIRGARTGNTKQGKQINPNKFLPR
jgi:hypothetical protein